MGALKSSKCRKGHSLRGNNLYIRKDGTRECRACSNRRATDHWKSTRSTTVRCSVDGCLQDAKTRGYCATHYERIRTDRTVDAPLVRRNMHLSVHERKAKKAAKDARYRARHSAQIAAKKRSRNLERPDLQQGRNARWRKAHPEQMRAITRQFRARHPDVVRRFPSNQPEARRKAMLEWMYGPGAAQHHRDQLAKQEDMCAICGKKLKLEQDHEHLTSRLRGALCGCCNRGIGFFKEDVEIIRKAIEYLLSWQQAKVS